MEAGQALLNAIATFRSAYADSLKGTDSALSGQQAEFFQNIRLSTAKLDQYLKDATTSLDGIADKLDAAARSLPFASDVPRVTRISPLFVAERQVSSRELVVKGVGLANKVPILWINGTPARPTTSTDSELRFQMPDKNGASNGRGFAAGVLQVYERRSGYIFPSYVPKYYPVRVMIYPTSIGPYSVVPRSRSSTPDEATRTTAPFRCESGNGEGRSTVPVSVTATGGWKIDTSTIVWRSSYSNHGSTTLNSQSESGFTATISCDGFGKVVVLGQTVDAGSKGVESGHYEYKERTVTNSLRDGDRLGGTLNLGPGRDPHATRMRLTASRTAPDGRHSRGGGAVRTTTTAGAHRRRRWLRRRR
jgi:hypothetical protein